MGAVAAQPEYPFLASAETTVHASRLRLWPALAIVALQWPLITIPARVAPGTMLHFVTMFWGGMLGVLAMLSWWMFASRLRWRDCWLGFLAFVGTGVLVYPFWHESFGLFCLAIYTLPVVTTAWVSWLALTLFLSRTTRMLGLVVVFFAAWGYFGLLRFDGADGNLAAELHYRWEATAEDLLQKDLKSRKPVQAKASFKGPALRLSDGDWPGFRGPRRDGRLEGVKIATDWQERTPRQLWRQRVGPGWSSLAVVGERIYTQEQRGEEEVVICYQADRGGELWAHRDAVRFTEPVAGPGPRATPTFHEGKIYALGAKGQLHCLDALTGQPLWSRDIVKDSGAKVPTWGFASSPLVVKDIVTVFAGGPDNKAVLGYRADSGELAWSAGEAKYSYCSLQVATVGGVEQLVLASDRGLMAFEPMRGDVLWEHQWPLQEGMARVVQPACLEGGDFLLGTGFGHGTRRLHVNAGAKGFDVSEKWTTLAIKPYFNDLVVHKDHLYGFDGSFLTCVNLADGKKQWRSRDYGSGQVLLLADQELLLVLAEQGAVALVEAKPGEHVEIGRLQALSGKTWNHPVVAQGKLFVRNGLEMACFDMREK